MEGDPPHRFPRREGRQIFLSPRNVARYKIKLLVTRHYTCSQHPMVQTTGLMLEAGKCKELVFSRAVRHDWRLLEVDEKMLQEIVDEG